MLGLNCLLNNTDEMRLIGAAMRSMSDAIIDADADAVVTVSRLYKQLKSVGVDIDLESTAYLYADVFASDMNNYSNFETEQQVADYANKYPPVPGSVKAALIAAGYSKKTKGGKDILDWTKLMKKTEQEIRDEIAALKLPDEDEIFAGLQNEYKQIVSSALIRARNDLRRKDTDVSPSERTAIDTIADLHVRGLFDDFADTYQNAIHKAIGTKREVLNDLTRINNLAKTARLLQLAGIGTNNDIGHQLQRQVNAIISMARFRDANWLLKMVRGFSVIVDMASLSILGGLSNRGQNYFSGKVGVANTAINYGYANKEVEGLAKSVKRDIIRGEGNDFGTVNNMFNGDRRSSDAVRQFLTSKLPTISSERAGNWWFNQLMGVAALNGVDNYNKVKNTWVRFIAGAEDIMLSKMVTDEDGHPVLGPSGEPLRMYKTKKEARAKLNEELFGDSWIKARARAVTIMDYIKAQGGEITKNDETIERFTADVVKAQLLENKILTPDEMTGAWNAGYKSAGMEMGHVSNNVFTTMLNLIKTHQVNAIEKAISKRKYTQAAFLTLTDIFVSKIAFRFAGGGTNWLFLKLEKGGLGVVLGLAGKGYYNSSFQDKKNLSSMSAKEIQETLYATQKTNDQLARGTAGLLVNSALLLMAMAAYDCERPDCKAAKTKVLNWMENNRWSGKYINNWLPWYLSAKVAYERQKRMPGGLPAMANFHGFEPGRGYLYNFMNSQEESTLEKTVQAIGKAISTDKVKHEKGMGELGQTFGQWGNFDPVPYRLWKDVYVMYEGAIGNINQTPVTPKSVWEGYLRWGITDWPVLKKK